jgi:hypothetical protein
LNFAEARRHSEGPRFHWRAKESLQHGPKKAGDPLVELETEKVSYELESPFSGILTRLLAHETVEVPVGDLLCEIAESAAKIARTKK